MGALNSLCGKDIVVVWSRAVVVEMGKKRGQIGEIFKRQSHKNLITDRT